MVTSKRGLEILKVDILKDRYVIAETNNTLIVGDLEIDKNSEIEWNGSGNEKFEFSSQGVCWISNAGEVSVIEFGVDEIIGTFRTEYVSSKHITATIQHHKG